MEFLQQEQEVQSSGLEQVVTPRSLSAPPEKLLEGPVLSQLEPLSPADPGHEMFGCDGGSKVKPELTSTRTDGDKNIKNMILFKLKTNF